MRKHLTIRPWRRRDRAVFAAIVTLAVGNLLLNLLNLVTF